MIEGSNQVLFVALAPHVDRPRAAALDGLSGDRLARLAGLRDRHDLLPLVAAHNLSPTPDPRPSELRKHRDAAAKVLARHGRAVLLGADVCLALGAQWRPWYEWREQPGTPPTGRLYATFPHPSGRVRVWNSPSERLRAQAFLRETLGLPQREDEPDVAANGDPLRGTRPRSGRTHTGGPAPDTGLRGERAELTALQAERAIGLLVAGRTRAEAAEEMGVAKETLNDWVRRPESRERIRQLTAEVAEETRRVLLASATRAARALDKTVAAGVRAIEAPDGTPRDPSLLSAAAVGVVGHGKGAAVGILDATGHRRVQVEIEVQQNFDEVLRRLQRRLGLTDAQMVEALAVDAPRDEPKEET